MLLLIAACNGPDEVLPPLDLTERLDDTTARAGVVTDEAALFAGISAEGQAGDIKLYNDRVQFVVQGLERDSHYYIQRGGVVVDADIVRPEGEPGHDLVDDWAPMVGLARTIEPSKLEILSEGRDGEAAHVRVWGEARPLRLLVGVFDTEDALPDIPVQVCVDYVLEPASWFLEVTTTVIAESSTEAFKPGDILLSSLDATLLFAPGHGIGEAEIGTYPYLGYLGKRGEGALGVFAAPGEELDLDATAELITSLADMAVGMGPSWELAEGEQASWTRLYGVGPDLATLTNAWHRASGSAAQTESGTVTAPDGPVEGAWVGATVDGLPATVAFTDQDGHFELDLPAGQVELVVSGRGTGKAVDLSPTRTHYSNYGAEGVRQQALASLTEAGEGPTMPLGRGVADPSDPLALGQPATLALSLPEGAPFEAWLQPLDPSDAVDSRLVPDTFKGSGAYGWSRDGDLELVAEAGRYELIAWRGTRHELHVEEVELVAGEELSVTLELAEAWEQPGDWLLGDPHMHASPSADGECPMEERVLVSAARGLNAHFSTDHDHIADYRPLVAAMGLDAHLRSVVGNEVSPVLRGHTNIYPVEPVTDAGNHFGWSWMNDLVDSTEEQWEQIRALLGPDFVVQLNHPTDDGVAMMAGWEPGEIGIADKWFEDFQAVEALNAGDHDEYLEFWHDLVLRGMEVTPTGVSDAHGPTSGDLGISATWMYAPGGLSAFDDEQLIETFRAGHVVVTRGPFLELSELPSHEAHTGSLQLEVKAHGPSWIQVDRLVLMQDEEVVEVVEGGEASFTLEPEADALYLVMAEGDTSMSPISGSTPWALAGPYKVDVDGDGWDAPLPPLLVE